MKQKIARYFGLQNKPSSGATKVETTKDETARPQTRREGYTKHLYLVMLNHRTGTFVGKYFEARKKNNQRFNSLQGKRDPKSSCSGVSNKSLNKGSTRLVCSIANRK